MLGAIAAALIALPAAAVPTMSFSIDGGAPILCADGDACDTNPAAGIIVFSDPLGPFLVNFVVGTTKPALSIPSLMDFSSLNVLSNGGAHTLTILYSDTGYMDVGPLERSLGGVLTAPAGSTVSASAYFGTALFEEGTLLVDFDTGPGAFAATQAGAAVPTAPYSLTQKFELVFTGSGSASVSSNLTVPEPATMGLLMIGFAGAAAASRRRSQA
jgi:hypothetical protein